MFSSQNSQVSSAANYIEECFSTYLYTGNGSTQTITNGIDLAGKGGLVWIKVRSSGSWGHRIFDTNRGAYKYLESQASSEQRDASPESLTSFNSTGFSLDDPDSGIKWGVNNGNERYASWTFRKQPKFFDVVTYTGDGTDPRAISHNLGSEAGCVIIKCTSNATNWSVYHRYDGTGVVLNLNSTAVTGTTTGGYCNQSSSTTFTVNASGGGTAGIENVNASGYTYVAYLFAHDAGGFGLTGTDNVISCGSYTEAATRTEVNLGFEPQWLLVKRTDSASNWYLVDTMRGMDNTSDKYLQPNLADAEFNFSYNFIPTAQGFTYPAAFFGGGSNIIYIAIRRGPMKVPTSGTSVFGLNARSGTGANATVTGGQTDDAVLIKNRGSAVANLFASRLTGTGYLVTSSTAAEVAAGATILQANPWDVMDGVKVGTTSTATNASSNTFINYLFKRAPSFFDEVCYTGTGSARTVTHNLGVAPELIIVKKRNAATAWATYSATLGNTQVLFLDKTDPASVTSTPWNDTSPTSSVFTVGTSTTTNASAATYVAYLFATCAGVSKVGSYTGTGATQTISCGFTGGARFVLIKRTDSTGNWYVWDTARGMVSGTDPSLLLNSTAAEANTDDVYTTTGGFQIVSTAAGINASGGSYIFLAIS